jgi:hypothetical protein
VASCPCQATCQTCRWGRGASLGGRPPRRPLGWYPLGVSWVGQLVSLHGQRPHAQGRRLAGLGLTRNGPPLPLRSQGGQQARCRLLGGGHARGVDLGEVGGLDH